jgi:RHS repeat-associated protein
LIQVTDRASVGGAPTQIIAYLYDVENRWIGENIESGAGVIQHETRFVYDGNQIVLQFDKDVSGATGSASAIAAADLSHRYLWGPAVDQILADEQVSNPQTPGNVVWPLTDNQGTVRDLAVCNQRTGTTAVVNHLVYSSYGQLLNQTNPATGNAAAVDCLFGYTGRPLDNTTGLQNNLNRWYDSSTGRWLSEDPIVIGGNDTNFHRYCGNSPVGATDPTGKAELKFSPSVENAPWTDANLPPGINGETTTTITISYKIVDAGSGKWKMQFTVTGVSTIKLDLSHIYASQYGLGAMFNYGVHTPQGVYGHEQKHMLADEKFCERLRDVLTKEEQDFGATSQAACARKAMELWLKYQILEVGSWQFDNSNHVTHNSGDPLFPNVEVPADRQDYPPIGTMPNAPPAYKNPPRDWRSHLIFTWPHWPAY